MEKQIAALSELALVSEGTPIRERIQMGITTGEQAKQYAKKLNMDPIDLLLEVRGEQSKAIGRDVVDRAINYLNMDKRLTSDRNIKRQMPTMGM